MKLVVALISLTLSTLAHADDFIPAKASAEEAKAARKAHLQEIMAQYTKGGDKEMTVLSEFDVGIAIMENEAELKALGYCISFTKWEKDRNGKEVGRVTLSWDPDCKSKS